MRKRTPLVLLVVLALGALSILQACSGGSKDSGSGGKVKITWSVWGNPGEQQRLQEFTDDFNKRHDDIEAELAPIPGSYAEKIKTMLTGKTAPDVFYADDSLMPQLINNGLIENLSPYLENSSINPDDLYQGLMTPATKDGNVYAIPPDMNPMVLWYNKKVLADAGIAESPADLYEQGQWTWQKFQEMTDKIRASGKHGYIVDTWWAIYYTWVSGNGGTFYSDDSYVGVSDPKSVEAYKYLYDNIQAKNFTFANVLPSGQGSEAQFMNNLAGFLSSGRWVLPNFKTKEGLEFDVVPHPTNTGKKIEPGAIADAFVVMNADSKHKEAAWTFIEEFNNKEGQLFRLKDGGNAVPTMIGLDSLVEEGNLPEHARYFLDAGEVGYVYPDYLYPSVSDEVFTQFDRLIQKKDVSFEEAMKEADVNANKKLQELKAQ
ncbi:ABC transporter substrate-binding protein [Cohnella cellulosilytica]|uniref:ABC transporter substrate-binding protein n=1 Tax=Cohnella cellulosilytica TaxID=986710 RepID=A0ABW2FGN5_9BACL